MKKLVLILLVLVATSIQAAPVVIYDISTGYSVGIQDLMINDITYNVEFANGSYNDVFAADAPTFLGDETGAEAAADAIMDALNNEDSTPQISGGTSEILWIPKALTNAFIVEQTGHNTLADPWERFGQFSNSVTQDYSDAPNSWVFVKFTHVPEPCTLFSLLGLSCLALRRKTT